MALSPCGRRVVWADAVRILAILCVVMIHTVAPLFTTQAVGSAGFNVGWLMDCIVQLGVPLFVMTSGVFMLDESREVTIRRAVTRYALPMVAFYFLWSVLYALANKVVEPVLFAGEPISGAMVKTFLIACVEGAYHLWYLPMTVGLYLLTPLLRAFVRRSNPRPAVYFLLLAGVFRFVLPAVLALVQEFFGWSLATTVDTFRLDIVAQYPAYYVAGWLIAGCRPTRRVRMAVYAGGLVCLVLMILMTGLSSVRHGEAVKLWMEPHSLFCAGYAVSAFAACSWELRRVNFSDRAQAAIGRLARLTFGVYLVHVEIQALYKVFIPYDGTKPLLYVLVQWAAVTVVSFVAAWVIGLIPGLRRLIRG